MDDVAPVVIASVKPAEDFGARRIDFRARSAIARENAVRASVPLPLPMPITRTSRAPSVAPYFPTGSLRPAKTVQKSLTQTHLHPVEDGHVTVPPQRPSENPERVLSPSRLEARRGHSSEVSDGSARSVEAGSGSIRRPIL